MELSRRELIAAFLGTAVANNLACQRRVQRAPIPGAIVDRAFATGHLLRAPAMPPPSVDPEKVEVLIVGGGIAGLSAAWRLQGGGVRDLVVVDVDQQLGGTSQSGRNAVSAYPWGAHYLPAPLRDEGPVVRLLRELGAVTGTDDRGAPLYAEQMLIREPEERLFYRGAWYEGLYLRAGASPEDLQQLERFEKQTASLSALRDGKGRKVFDVPLERGSDDAEFTALDRLSMAQWMEQQRYTSPRLRWLVDYACRDDFGAASEHTSAWAGLWYFCARREGTEDNQGYLSWPEGNGRLVQQLSDGLAPRQRRAKVLIHTVVPGDDHCLAYGVEADSGAPVAFRARQVVLACPRFVAKHVVAPWREQPPEAAAAFQYSPWVVANLTVSEPPYGRGFPLSWDNVFYESRSLGYVVATHQRELLDDSGPTVLTWYYPLAGGDVRVERERLLQAQYPEWEAIVSADLRAAHPELDRTATRLEVMRWGHAMVRPVPGFLWSGVRERAAQSFGRSLHFAHSDLGGMALFEAANWHGIRAGERVLVELGRSAPTWL